MNRIAFVVDGFNVYHSLRSASSEPLGSNPLKDFWAKPQFAHISPNRCFRWLLFIDFLGKAAHT